MQSNSSWDPTRTGEQPSTVKRPGIHPGRFRYSHLFLAAPLSAATALPSTTLTTASSLLPATAAVADLRHHPAVRRLSHPARRPRDRD